MKLTVGKYAESTSRRKGSYVQRMTAQRDSDPGRDTFLIWQLSALDPAGSLLVYSA